MTKAMIESSAPAAPTWDLSELYADPDDPRLDADLAAVLALAEAFEAEYKGRLARLDEAALAEAFGRYEAILVRAQPPSTYARLVHSADTSNPRHGALVARVQERTVRVHTHLLFVDLELAAFGADRLQAIARDPRFARVRHYIQKASAGETPPAERAGGAHSQREGGQRFRGIHALA